MPQFYKKKTDREVTSENVMRKAVKEVIEETKAVRSVAKSYGIPRSTLQRYIAKFKNSNEAAMTPNFRQRMFFTVNQEKEIKDYLITCSNRYYGMTRAESMRFVYELAVDNNVSIPDTWHREKSAGDKWMAGFMARNRELSLRQPEATSIARACAFNRPNITFFFDELKKALEATKVTGDRIYNLDESGFTTVQAVPKVISPRGQKQVGQLTSRERGELVTCVGIINAIGNKLPPVMIFPRKHWNNSFMLGASEGALGLVNPQTGSAWMTQELFIRVIEHIMKHTKPSKDNPLILVMDNHTSHCGYRVLKLAKDNGIHIVTLPPHTSNKTQPLDLTVFGPMTHHYNSMANSWQMMNAEDSVDIYKSAALICDSYTKACSAPNILSGFKAAGIWPYDREVFTDIDFLPATVTERDENRTPGMDQPQPGTSTSTVEANPPRSPTVPSGSNATSEPPPSTSLIISRPLPHKKSRPTKPTKRKKTEHGYINSTPSLRKKKPADYNSSSDDDESAVVPVDDSSADEMDEEEQPNPLPEEITFEDGRYYVVKFYTKKSHVFYVGRLKGNVSDGEVEVQFYRRGDDNLFRLPTTDDVAFVKTEDIHTMLPNPTTLTGSSRQRGQTSGLKFGVEFGNEVR